MQLGQVIYPPNPLQGVDQVNFDRLTYGCDNIRRWC